MVAPSPLGSSDREPEPRALSANDEFVVVEVMAKVVRCGHINFGCGRPVAYPTINIRRKRKPDLDLKNIETTIG